MISLATTNDIAEICRLEQENMPHPYSQKMVEELFCNERVKVLKAVKNNRIVGYVSAETVFDESSINNVAVDGTFRRQGIGDALLGELKVQLRGVGSQKIFLEVASRNLPAISLYEKNGFKQISVRKGYYGDDDAIIMQYDM